jgi:hypothetical protein
MLKSWVKIFDSSVGRILAEETFKDVVKISNHENPNE